MFARHHLAFSPTQRTQNLVVGSSTACLLLDVDVSPVGRRFPMDGRIPSHPEAKIASMYVYRKRGAWMDAACARAVHTTEEKRTKPKQERFPSGRPLIRRPMTDGRTNEQNVKKRPKRKTRKSVWDVRCCPRFKDGSFHVWKWFRTYFRRKSFAMIRDGNVLIVKQLGSEKPTNRNTIVARVNPVWVYSHTCQIHKYESKQKHSRDFNSNTSDYPSQTNVSGFIVLE